MKRYPENAISVVYKADFLFTNTVYRYLKVFCSYLGLLSFQFFLPKHTMVRVVNYLERIYKVQVKLSNCICWFNKHNTTSKKYQRL